MNDKKIKEVFMAICIIIVVLCLFINFTIMENPIKEEIKTTKTKVKISKISDNDIGYSINKGSEDKNYYYFIKNNKQYKLFNDEFYYYFFDNNKRYKIFKYNVEFVFGKDNNIELTEKVIISKYKFYKDKVKTDDFLKITLNKSIKDFYLILKQ